MSNESFWGRVKSACDIIMRRCRIVYMVYGHDIEPAKRAALDIYGRAMAENVFSGDGDEKSAAARIEMMMSVLYDKSVILQSIHDGKPTVIYDCGSEADFELLKSQNIETNNLHGHEDDSNC